MSLQVKIKTPEEGIIGLTMGPFYVPPIALCFVLLLYQVLNHHSIFEDIVGGLSPLKAFFALFCIFFPLISTYLIVFFYNYNKLNKYRQNIQPKDIDEIFLDDCQVQFKKHIDRKNCQVLSYSYEDITSVKMTLCTKNFSYYKCYTKNNFDYADIDIVVDTQKFHICMFSPKVLEMAQYLKKVKDFTYEIQPDINDEDKKGLIKYFEGLKSL